MDHVVNRTPTNLLDFQVTELQTAYDELKSNSEKEIGDLRVQVATLSPSSGRGKFVHCSNEGLKPGSGQQIKNTQTCDVSCVEFSYSFYTLLPVVQISKIC